MRMNGKATAVLGNNKHGNGNGCRGLAVAAFCVWWLGT
jgi:hypothetical protein